jgi:predicted nucleic acid-binding Zn ribbon protein
MLSAAGFQLKGSGWYVTDFRNNGTKPSSKSSDTSKGESKPSSDAKDAKDTKPAASDTKPTPTSGNPS